MADDTVSPSPALAAILASTRPTIAPLDPARQKQSNLATSSSTSAPPKNDGPIPMSFPAILVQPKNKHLLGALGKKAFKDENQGGTSSARKGAKDGAPGGRRRRRRWENAQLAGNPHLHRPTRADFNPGPSLKGLSTTFAPPPSNFSRSTYSSPVNSAASNSSISLESGQFTMSLKGLRKNLRTGVVGSRVTRGQGGRTEEVLEIMERELSEWLTFEGRVSPGFYHDGSLSAAKILDPTPLEDWQPPPSSVDSLPDEPVSRSRPPPSPPATLVELTRLPHTLVWLAPSPQHRYLLHSLARYYRLQSFSRPLSPLDPSVRVTHILQPQIARPTIVSSGFDTPSATDWSSASALSTEVSASETETEAEFTDGGVTTTDDEEDGVTTNGEGESVDGRTLEELELSGSEGESDYGADRELGFSTDEDDTDYVEVDSLASSFADLNGLGGTTNTLGSGVPSNPTSISTTPRRASAPFLPYTPSSALPSSLSISTTPRANTRARGRRSLPTTNGGGIRLKKGEWKMPERSFVDWVFN
ncbi:uncharacterized protein JCM6883_004444 [Sporobolomyces salmoneus]|uniref:uncharacterized protein n=1 Tax=Sporobolomyces salmoneus TaxID=183962 RepID=UPI00316D0BCF